MISDVDPLTRWQDRVMANLYAEPWDKAHQQRVAQEQHQKLYELQRLIAETPQGKPNYEQFGYAFAAMQGFSASDCAIAEQVALAVWRNGGKGSQIVLSGLLQSIALALQPSSLSFWIAALNWKKPRDSSAEQREIYAIAAICLLAGTSAPDDAEAVLCQLLQHPAPRVRAMVAYYLGSTGEMRQDGLSQAALNALKQCALHDTDTPTRYQARNSLWMFGQSLPRDNPKKVYRFNVQLKGHAARRVIDMRSKHTLAQLHAVIQDSFEWDSDHLYSFFVNGIAQDMRYQIDCPDLDGDEFSLSLHEMMADIHLSDAMKELAGQAEFVPEDHPALDAELGEMDVDDEERDAIDTTTISIGELGLLPKHTMLYFYDYGDNHEFLVTLEEIIDPTPKTRYPRLVRGEGASPPQYPFWDDEEDYEDEDGAK